MIDTLKNVSAGIVGTNAIAIAGATSREEFYMGLVSTIVQTIMFIIIKKQAKKYGFQKKEKSKKG